MTELTTANIIDIVSSVATSLAALSSLLLWILTRKNVALLSKQVNNQLATNKSIAYQNAINAHRDLYIQLLTNPVLSDQFFQIINSSKDEGTRSMIAVFMINHAVASYVQYKNKVIDEDLTKDFSVNLRNLFSIPTVKEQWEKSKRYHSKDFRQFVEENCLS